MKFVLGSSNDQRYMFRMILATLFVFLLNIFLAHGQESMDSDGTLVGLLRQVDMRTQDTESIRVNDDFSHIVLMQPMSSGESSFFIAGKYLQDTTTYRISQINEENFCVTLNVNDGQSSSNIEQCSAVSNIASIVYYDVPLPSQLNDLSILRSADDLGGLISQYVHFQSDVSATSSEHVEGFFMQFFSSVFQISDIDGLLFGVNFVLPSGARAIAYLSSIWDEYFCIAVVRGSDGAGSQTNYCIPYTNVAEVRLVYRDELPDYPNTFPNLQEFIEREYSNGLTPPGNQAPTDPSAVSAALDLFLHNDNPLPLDVNLIVPLSAATSTLRLTNSYRQGEITFLLTHLGTNYFCIAQHNASELERERCVTFANVAALG